MLNKPEITLLSIPHQSWDGTGGANDHGLDVVGYTDAHKLEGIWDNSQCKHYRTSIPTAEGLADVGKVVYWAHQGKFKPPKHSRFIAPKGPSGPLRTLLDNPSLLKFSTAGSNTVLGK